MLHCKRDLRNNYKNSSKQQHFPQNTKDAKQIQCQNFKFQLDYAIKILRTYDPAFCAHFLDRSSISLFLHHISFLLVNLGFTMPIKLY